MKKFLQTTRTYTSHKASKTRFKRRKTIVAGINDQWQMDLVDISHLKTYNNGVRFLLTIIDCFSRKAMVKPLKSKRGEEVKNAFKEVLIESKVKPTKVQFDRGKEFLNFYMKSFLVLNNIQYFNSFSYYKAAICERFNRTLQEKIYKYLTAKNTKRYIDVLEKLVESYNNSHHRSIGCAPNKVNKLNEREIWKKLYRNFLFDKKPHFAFKIGDAVRIKKKKKTFQKGYLGAWGITIYYIFHRINTLPSTYILRTENHELLPGIYYTEELNKVLGLD